MNLQYPLHDSYFAFKHLHLIKCKEHKFIIIGWNSSQTQFNALIIPKIKTSQPLRPLSQLLIEVGPYKTLEEAKEGVQLRIGSFVEKEVIKAQGILGFYRFFQGYYMTYIKESQPIARIGRHKICQIKNVQILQLFDLRSDETQSFEKQYRRLLGQYKLQNYYYSCSYDLSNPLARNMTISAMPLYDLTPHKLDPKPSIFCQGQEEYMGVCQKFQYNHNQIKQFFHTVKCKKWILAVIHGFCKHINIKFKGTIFNLIVIARRSRHHAGTRYIKRGIDQQGFAANFVEVEQIVINYNTSQDTRPVCSSFVQVRGSVPTYWMQKPSFAIPKPPIQLRTNVDYMCVGTRKQFHDLVCRYGRIIFCVNLMKKHEKTPRQSELSKQYSNAITLINKNDLKEQNALHYSEIDMKFQLKRDKKAFVQQIKTLAYFTVQKTGLFICTNASTSSHQQLIEFQNGVIRANCVDCLDRTNSFQQLVGQAILVIQLNRLIGQDSKPNKLDLDEPIIEGYSQLYEEMGDLVSIQYGSSLAHKQKIQKTTQSRFELFTSLQRHFNNNFKDEPRQTQIDVFLGYRPDSEGAQLWQLKPVIQHYPNQYANSFQKMNKNEWFQQAYQHFRRFYRLNDFAKISKLDSYESNIPKMEKVTKQQLIHKFRGDIVASLINDKEQPAGCRWLVEPKIFIQQRVWKQMNPRSANFRTLQEELNMTYNKMDFLKEQEPDLRQSNRVEKEVSSPKKSQKSGRAPKIEQDLESTREYDRYAAKQTALSEDELRLVQKICSGDLGLDEQIEKNVQDLYSLVGEDVMRETFMNENFITEADIINELKRIQVNLAAQNFMANAEDLSSEELVYRRDQTQELKTQKILQPKRREMARQNRVKMLEQIMAKTFSHGGITEITQI